MCTCWMLICRNHVGIPAKAMTQCGGRSAAGCLYSGERGILVSVGRASIGRSSGAKRQGIDGAR